MDIREVNLPSPAEETVITISDAQPPVTTQPLRMDNSGSPSSASSISKEEGTEEFDNSVGISVGNSGVDRVHVAEDTHQDSAIAIHVADEEKVVLDNIAEKRADETASVVIVDSVKANELESDHPTTASPEVGVVQTVDDSVCSDYASATDTDTGTVTASTVCAKITNNKGPEETSRQLLVPGPEVKEMESNMSQYILLGLPIDALHAIASFLSPKDLCNFGLCSKGATKVCGDVFRRVRMHGFRCATEVITAWTLNQHSDAKELCALYIGAGVPIYPLSLGHSYHTTVWRMGIEAQEMQNASRNADSTTTGIGTDNTATIESNNGENEIASGTPVDRFFVERYETRAREGLNFSISYLEEKSIYMLNSAKHADEANSFAQSVRRQMSMAPNRFVVRPPHNHGHVHMEDRHAHGAHGEVIHAEGRAPQLFRHQSTEIPVSIGNEAPRRGVSRSSSQSDLRGRSPKVVVKVHRHLLDQHLLGRPFVDDKDGLMTAAPVNLSADFFHPHFKASTITARNESALHAAATNYTSSGLVSGALLPAWNHSFVPPQHPVDLGTRGNGIGDLLADPVAGMNGHHLPPADATDDSDSDVELANHQVLNAAETIFEPPAVVLQAANAGSPVVSSVAQSEVPKVNPYPTPTHPNILVNVDLEVYSASLANKKVDVDQEDREIRHHLRTRFAVYQRRLENHLSQHDSHGFDECMLDFWDEFLPHTANIHYYDRNTAVPRISCLHKFLTRPCPKAIGVVQCEIERIKLGPKKKGVNMKGRFFPTYEYRLFIRHRPPEASDGSEPQRRDTVLMMAKNRGRKHVESSASSAAGKKGANNYFLYIPQQEEVEQHFRSVNGLYIPSESIRNGASSKPMPLDGPALMGRLQSNFIGTEFQIFTPQVAKKGQVIKNAPKRSYTTPVNSGLIAAGYPEDEFGYDSGVSSDNPSSSGRRRSRFGRLSLRRNGGSTPSEPTTIAEDDPPMKPLRRSRSSGDMAESNRRTRTSRRAIANNSEGVDVQRSHPPLLEEEDGAITYTANLLGSRPRIMDVCIPRVSPDGVPGAEWMKYLDNCLPDVEGGASNRMLNHLKQIQQRLENEEHGVVTRSNQGEVDVNNIEDYSPPDDFGLLALQNRPPWWNIELGSFVLNFGGRVSVASVKNFQLCDRVDQDYIMLQFGRIQGRHSFTMDFQHPLTAVQAFAIAISSLQSKISFG